MSRLALLLTGELRTFDHPIVKKNLNKFRQEYNVDVFGCFWKKRGRSSYSIKINLDDGIDCDEVLDVSYVMEILNTKNVKLYDYGEWINDIDTRRYIGSYGYEKKYFDPLFANSYLRRECLNLIKKDDVDVYKSFICSRSDIVFFSRPPDYFFEGTSTIWHQRHNFIDVIYSTFFSSNYETINTICSMYGSEKLDDSINYPSNRYGNRLEHCGVMYAYTKILGIQEDTYRGTLFAEPFRSESDIKEMEVYSRSETNYGLKEDDFNWFPNFK